MTKSYQNNLMITNVNFEVRGIRMYYSFTDKRDNDRQNDCLLQELYIWLNANEKIPFQECREYAFSDLSVDQVRRFLEDTGRA